MSTITALLRPTTAYNNGIVTPGSPEPSVVLHIGDKDHNDLAIHIYSTAFIDDAIRALVDARSLIYAAQQENQDDIAA